MLTSLLAKPDKPPRALIEVMEGGAGPAAEAAEGEDPDEWEWDQQLAPEAAAASDLLGMLRRGTFIINPTYFRI